MKKKIFVSLATVAVLMSSGFATTSTHADSVGPSQQVTSTVMPTEYALDLSVSNSLKAGEIHAPVVYGPVYEGDTLLKGRGSKIGNEIIVKNIGGAVVGAGTVGLDLEFTVAILPEPAYAKLFVTETDGTHTSEVTEVIVHEAHLKIK